MSRGTQVIRSILEALSRALGSRSTASQRQPAKKHPERGLAKWKTHASSDRAAYGDSPGQFRPDATRDLSGSEIQSLVPEYEPKLDGDPDPGEVIWTWVPYVENDGRGKDRPVLIIARIDARSLAGCYLSTKDHRGFVSVGRGPWDSKGRESFLSPERVLRVTEVGMRRESGGVGREAFERVVAAVREYHGA